MRLRIKAVEATPALGVPGVSRHHPQFLHTPSHLHVLSPVVLGTESLTSPPEPPQGLSAQYVARPATEIALPDYHLKMVPEIDGFRRRVRRQHVAHVLQNDVGVVVCFHKPVRVVKVILIDVVEGTHCLGREVIPAQIGLYPDGRETLVLLVAHVQNLVAPLTPRGVHVYGLGTQVAR